MLDQQIKPTGILVVFHCKEDTGYAISSLEKVFYESARMAVGDNIHFSFTELNQRSRRSKLYKDVSVIQFDPKKSNKMEIDEVCNYIKKNKIDTVLGFDQPPGANYYRSFRKAGIRRIVSYWGAPMSSINKGLKLWLKKIEMLLRIYSPDHYIFESYAMYESAVYGRGIMKKKCSVVYLGVDTEVYKPDDSLSGYAYDAFSIPRDRKIIFYSGHMEKRKGVHVIVKSSVHLIDELGYEQVHFVILGNKNGEEKVFEEILEGTKAKEHVTFGGYRNDVSKILPGCYVGVIASTGWDSFTMSSLEMSASGLPLIVSSLQGLRESVDDGKTGFLFKPGDHEKLASLIVRLINNDNLRSSMSAKSVERVNKSFSLDRQVEKISDCLVQ